MKTEEEIRKVLDNMRETRDIYDGNAIHECTGAIKALEWVLELED